MLIDRVVGGYLAGRHLVALPGFPMWAARHYAHGDILWLASQGREPLAQRRRASCRIREALVLQFERFVACGEPDMWYGEAKDF